MPSRAGPPLATAVTARQAAALSRHRGSRCLCPPRASQRRWHRPSSTRMMDGAVIRVVSCRNSAAATTYRRSAAAQNSTCRMAEEDNDETIQGLPRCQSWAPPADRVPMDCLRRSSGRGVSWFQHLVGIGRRCRAGAARPRSAGVGGPGRRRLQVRASRPGAKFSGCCLSLRGWCLCRRSGRPYG